MCIENGKCVVLISFLYSDVRALQDDESDKLSLDEFRRGLDEAFEFAKRKRRKGKKKPSKTSNGKSGGGKDNCTIYEECSDKCDFMSIANPRAGGGASAGCTVACGVKYPCNG
jgi:hypothetical protein